MENKQTIVKNVLGEFAVGKDSMLHIAQLFKDTMEKSLKGEKTCLKMLPSYIGKPTGKEKGIFMTIDMGGTNLRCTKFSIEDGDFKNLGEIKEKLISKDKGYDLTKSDTNAQQLFDFMAKCMSTQVEKEEKLYLGNTFSFPCKQIGINESYLIAWTKEIAVSGVEGENINKLLAEALKREGLNVEPVAILNDTVGTLLVAMYSYKDADIGSIMGTGHNTCYLENNHPINNGKMIVNIESGNYNVGLPITKYDRIVDENSKIPGDQLLEKMVSGYYMGRVVQQVLIELYNKKVIFADNDCADKYLAEEFTALTSENFILYPEKTMEKYSCSMEDAIIIQQVAKAVLNRTIKLVATTYIGILMHQENNDIKSNHVIAIDGTIYEKMPNARDLMNEAFKEALGSVADKIEIRLVKDGSGLGAAIAAAVAVTQK